MIASINGCGFKGNKRLDNDSEMVTRTDEPNGGDGLKGVVVGLSFDH